MTKFHFACCAFLALQIFSPVAWSEPVSESEINEVLSLKQCSEYSKNPKILGNSLKPPSVEKVRKDLRVAFNELRKNKMPGGASNSRQIQIRDSNSFGSQNLNLESLMHLYFSIQEDEASADKKIRSLDRRDPNFYYLKSHTRGLFGSTNAQALAKYGEITNRFKLTRSEGVALGSHGECFNGLLEAMTIIAAEVHRKEKQSQVTEVNPGTEKYIHELALSQTNRLNRSLSNSTSKKIDVQKPTGAR